MFLSPKVFVVVLFLVERAMIWGSNRDSLFLSLHAICLCRSAPFPTAGKIHVSCLFFPLGRKAEWGKTMLKKLITSKDSAALCSLRLFHFWSQSLPFKFWFWFLILGKVNTQVYVIVVWSLRFLRNQNGVLSPDFVWVLTLAHIYSSA